MAMRLRRHATHLILWPVSSMAESLCSGFELEGLTAGLLLAGVHHALLPLAGLELLPFNPVRGFELLAAPPFSSFSFWFSLALMPDFFFGAILILWKPLCKLRIRRLPPLPVWRPAIWDVELEELKNPALRLLSGEPFSCFRSISDCATGKSGIGGARERLCFTGAADVLCHGWTGCADVSVSRRSKIAAAKFTRPVSFRGHEPRAGHQIDLHRTIKETKQRRLTGSFVFLANWFETGSSPFSVP
jgi:hypothetical protein